ncbi:MAG: hypothetical protein QM758_03575 [Armatimonas sp.]
MTDQAILNKVKVASPCSADWNAMEGDDQARFCGQCKKNVYNLSAMTEKEAAELVRNTEGRLCVRYYRRADGTMLTADCPVGAEVKKRRTVRNLTVLATAGAALTAYRMARTPEPVSAPVAGTMIALPMVEATPEPAMMGDMAAPPPPRPEPTMGIVMSIPERKPTMGKPTMGEAPVAQERIGRVVMGARAPMPNEK